MLHDLQMQLFRGKTHAKAAAFNFSQPLIVNLMHINEHVERSVMRTAALEGTGPDRTLGEKICNWVLCDVPSCTMWWTED